jgi:hypothetical protein
MGGKNKRKTERKRITERNKENMWRSGRNLG